MLIKSMLLDLLWRLLVNEFRCTHTVLLLRHWVLLLLLRLLVVEESIPLHLESIQKFKIGQASQEIVDLVLLE
jgi:hypothetical protein